MLLIVRNIRVEVCEFIMNKYDIVYFGKVTKYLSDKGYGFINHLRLEENKSTFFHIKNVKHLNIEDNLVDVNENKKPVYIWYTTEATKKGIALKQSWLSYKDIASPQLKPENIIIRPKDFFPINILENIFSNERLQPKLTIRRDPHPEKSTMRFSPNDLQDVTQQDVKEIIQWISIYRDQCYIEHKDVNNYITRNNRWDDFPNMRSLNDHGSHKNVPGITPDFYRLCCNLLSIEGLGGASLDFYKKY
jgi:hypothetical protein